MKSWVTLIELLIAIVIFWIWVIYVVGNVIWNISYVERTSMKTQSTFLAKEGIEIAYNLVDSNIERWMHWNCANYDTNDYSCDDFLWSWNSYYKAEISTWSAFSISSISNTNHEDNILYFHTWDLNWYTWFWYDHDDTWKETDFSRYLYFTWVYSEGDSWVLDKSEILKVKSVVKFKKWAYTWDVTLESFVWNVR